MASTTGTLTKISFRTLGAHKVRFFLTVLSVILGTAFVAGSFMFTNSLQKSFDGIVSNSYQGVDAVIKPKNDGARPLDTGLREQLAADPAVGAVNVSSPTTVVVADKDQNTFNTGGAPSVAQPYYAHGATVGPAVSIVDGSEPHGSGEAIINATAAKQHNVKVGDTILVVDQNSRHELKVSGIYDIDLATGGYLGVSMEEKAYLDMFRPDGAVGELFVSSAQGQAPQEFVNYLKKAYPGVQVLNGEKVAEEKSAEVDKGLGFMRYFLLAFGLIALLVGTFIIANTFSMIVAQRMREFALLRSLGASQQQLTASVVIEAIIVGLIGSALGFFAGLGLVKLIFYVLSSLGLGLPQSGLEVTPEAVAVPLVVGVIVTVISAWAPARRAGQVRPVEAMRLGDISSSSSLKLRSILGLIVLTVGIAIACFGVFSMTDAETGTRASVVGAAAVLVILGTFMFSPALSIPIVPAIGRILGLPFGATGRLASTNSKRNPRRTATTAFALTLGVALVAVIGTLGATMKNSVSELTESAVASDLIVSGPLNSGFAAPQKAVDDIRALDSVKSTSAMGMLPINVARASQFQGQTATAFIDGQPRDMFKLQRAEGTLAFDGPGAIMEEKVAKEHGLHVGDQLPVEFGREMVIELGKVTLVGTYKETKAMGPLLINKAAVDQVLAKAPQLAGNDVMKPRIHMIGVNAKDGVTEDQLRADLEKTVKNYIVLTVQTKTEWAGSQAVMVDQMLNILYGLLALAIIVAILGIINTLALNVVERRQEVGMLRAVGTKRSQIRTMITLEAVQISVYGALVGIAIGMFLGWAFIKVLEKEGLGDLTVPWSQLALMMVGSAIVGVIAALWPAHKASRTPPLDAIAD